MKQSIVWLPSPEVLEDDTREYNGLVALRRAKLIEDHETSGYLYPVWITDRIFVSKLFLGIKDWIEARDGLISYESFGNTVLVSFKTRTDAVLYKLTWGGVLT